MKPIYVFLLLVIAERAMAKAQSAFNEVGAKMLEVVLVHVIQGPMGFLAAVMLFIMAMIMAIRQQVLTAGAAVLGGVFLLKAPHILDALGATVP